MTKIYTRTGDKGKTSLYSGLRVNKNSLFIEGLGSVDEGNSAIGFALSFLPKDEKFTKTKKQLETIQHALFDVGAALATPRSCDSTQKLEQTSFNHDAIDLLEQWIDEMESSLPKLTHFILPGGHSAGAALHLSRSIIRRSERAVYPLFEQGDVAQDVLTYLNRLSDYLFVVSRFVNNLSGVPEKQWKPHSELDTQP